MFMRLIAPRVRMIRRGVPPRSLCAGERVRGAWMTNTAVIGWNRVSPALDGLHRQANSGFYGSACRGVRRMPSGVRRSLMMVGCGSPCMAMTANVAIYVR